MYSCIVGAKQICTPVVYIDKIFFFFFIRRWTRQRGDGRNNFLSGSRSTFIVKTPSDVSVPLLECRDWLVPILSLLLNYCFCLPFVFYSFFFFFTSIRTPEACNKHTEDVCSRFLECCSLLWFYFHRGKWEFFFINFFFIFY